MSKNIFISSLRKSSVILTAILVVSGFFISNALALTGITVISPIGGEYWRGTQDITWTADCQSGDQVNIYYSTDDSSAKITGNVACNDYSYSWNTTGVLDGNNYKIKVRDTSDADVFNVSGAFTIDNTAPTFTIIAATDAGPVKTDTINVTITEDYGVAVSEYGFSADNICDETDTYGNGNAFTSGGDFNIAGDHTDYLCVMATDNAGNTGYQLVGQLNTDNTAPILITVSIASDNANTTLAKTGDTVTLTFTADESLSGIPAVTIDGNVPDSVINGDGNNYTATRMMQAGDTEQVVIFTIDFADVAGNNADQATNTTDASSVTFDETAPTFTIQYYTDAELTTLLGNNPVLKTGIYYIKITANESLLDAPTISIDAEGTNNDVTNDATTLISGNDYIYTRAIVSDASAVGSVLEDVSITGTDLAGNTATNVNPTDEVTKAAYTDTTAPAIQGTTLISPNGEEYWAGGLSQTIAWIAGDITDTNLKASPITLEYYDGSSWVQIATDEANGGSYNWTVPLLNIADAKVRITATDLASNTASDESDGDFTIDSTDPTATVVASVDPIKDSSLSQTITVTYDEAMNPGIDPTVIIAGLTSSYNLTGGTWNTVIFTNDTYTVSQLINDDEEKDTATVEVSGAVDLAGNSQTAESTTFEVDTLNPTITSTTAAPDPAKAGDVVVTVTFGEIMDSTTPTLGFTGITGTMITKNDGAWSSETTWTETFTLSDADEEKTATISVAGAQDLVDNVMAANPTAGTFVVDTIDPTITAFNAPVADAVYKTDPPLQFTPDDTGTDASCSYTINGGSPVLVACTKGIAVNTTIPELADGRRSLVVTVTDAAGNLVNSSPVSFVYDNNNTLTVAASGADFTTIQEAINKATAEDTINVSAGTYDETVELKDTTAPGISIIGQDKTSTFITGGIGFATDYSGLKVQNFTITGNGFLGTETYEATVTNVWPGHRVITDLEFSDCIFDGEGYDDGKGGRMGIVIKRLGGVVKFVNNEFKNYPGSATLDVNDGSGGGALTVTSYTLINNKFLDNGGGCALRGNPEDYTDTVIVTGNTFDGPAGWAALEVNRAENVEIYDNVIRNVEEFRDWGEGQAMQLWQVGTVEIYENTIENNYQGIAILNYPEPYDISNISVHHNSFSGNAEYALSVDDGLIGGPLDATNNWWGTAYKPTIQSNISDSVIFEPYYVDEEKTTLSDVLVNAVYVDDDYEDGLENDGYYFGYDAFAVIQEGIDAVAENGTINVAAGTYTENVVINKTLTLEGAQAGVNARGRTGPESIINAQLAEFAVLINGAETVATIDGFTVENYDTVGILGGAFSTVLEGVTLGEDPLIVHILNNIVKPPTVEAPHNNNIQIGDGTTGTITGNDVSGALLESEDWSGSGIIVAGSSNVLISYNYVHNSEGGIQIIGYLEYRDAPAENNIIEYNWVEDNESGIVPQMYSIGTIIRYNDVLNNDEGIAVMAIDYPWPEHSTPSGTEVHYNNIVGNDEGVVSGVWGSDTGNVLAEEVDATDNWWGTAYKPTIESNISGSVIFEPYWVNSEMTISSDPSPDTVYVDDNYSDGSAGEHIFGYDAFAIIQEGIDAAASGGTVNVAAGTYTESVLIGKPLTLQGPNVGISPNTGSRVAEAVITGVSPLVELTSGADVNPLTIEGFTFSVLDATAEPVGGSHNGSVILADGASDGWSEVTILSNRFIENYGPAIGVWTSPSEAINPADWTITDNLIDGVRGTDRSGIYLDLVTDLATGFSGWEISNNTIKNTEYGGIMVHGAVAIVISGNTIEDVQKTGIQSSGIQGNVTITDNVITRAMLAQDEPFRAGIRLYGVDPADEYGPSQLIDPVWVTNNTVTDSYIGFAIKEGHDITGKVVLVTGNSFTGNTEAGLRHLGGGLLDATNNWWGSNQKSDVEAAISGLVDFTPWWLDAAMTILSDTDITGPTVVLTNDIGGRTQVRDDDTVLITATFSDDNGLDTGVAPQITIINGDVTDEDMTDTADLNIWTFDWDVPDDDDVDELATISIATKDIVGNDAQAPIGITTYTIDNTEPVLAQVTLVPTPTNNTTPDYTFSSDEAGTMTYGGSCSSATINALAGSNTITFDALEDGTYNDCTIIVTDAAGNESDELDINEFTIDTTAPVTTDDVPAGWQTADVTVTLTCDDSVGGNSGCLKVYYTTDGTDPTISSSFVDEASSWQFTVSTDGDYTIKYRGEDVVGNLEATKTAANSLQLDKTAPTINNLAPSNGSITSDTTPTISADFTEALSGIDTSSVVITVDGTDVTIFAAIDTSGIAYTPGNAMSNGIKTATIDVSDAAGNPATQASWRFEVAASITSVSVATDKSSLMADGSTQAKITALVLDNGSPVTSGNVTFATVIGTLTSTSATLDANGKAITYLTSTETGQTTVTAYYDAPSGLVSGTVNITFTATLKTISVVSDPSNVLADGETESTITATILDNNNPIVGGTVSFTTSLGTLSSASAVSNASGEASVTITSSDIGSATIAASYNTGDGTISDTVEVSFTGTVTVYNISLFAGWNLISIPVVPNNTSISVVLGDAESKIDAVWNYDPSNPKAVDGWLVYVPGNLPETNNLDTMTAGYGYWANITENTSITGSGSLFTVGPNLPPSRILSPGWNLIGYYQIPGTDSDAPSSAFASLKNVSGQEYWNALWGFNNQLGIFNSVSTILPGDGFWILLGPDRNEYLYTPSNIK